MAVTEVSSLFFPEDSSHLKYWVFTEDVLENQRKLVLQESLLRAATALETVSNGAGKTETTPTTEGSADAVEPARAKPGLSTIAGLSPETSPMVDNEVTQPSSSENALPVTSGGEAALATLPISMSVPEVQALLFYFASQLIYVCKEKKLDFRVTSTAATLLIRFFLRRSVIDYDPRRVLVTCILLGIKIEEASNSVRLTHFCEGLVSSSAKGGLPLADVLAYELPVLDALQFHLHVLHVRTPLQLVTSEYYNRRRHLYDAPTAQSATGGASGAATEKSGAAYKLPNVHTVEEFSKFVAGLNSQAEELSLSTFASDIPLLFTPAHVAVCCFLAVARDANVEDASEFIESLLYKEDGPARRWFEQKNTLRGLFEESAVLKGLQFNTLKEKLRPTLTDLQIRLTLFRQDLAARSNDDRAQAAFLILKKLDKLARVMRKKGSSKKKRRQSPSRD